MIIYGKDLKVFHVQDKKYNIENNPDYYGIYSSALLIEKEHQRIKAIDKVYPLITRKE